MVREQEVSNLAVKFELLSGLEPGIKLAEHPVQPYVAMQTSSVLLSGIWDSSSGAFHWLFPEITIACSWLPDGSELILVVQKDGGSFLERYSWPNKQVKSSTQIICAAGQPSEHDPQCLVVSPRGNYVAVRLFEQNSASIELFRLIPDGTAEPRKGYSSHEFNILEGPKFSPDELHVVMSFSAQPGWWNPDDPDCSSVGGKFEIGRIAILVSDSGAVYETGVHDTIPEDWLPDDPDDFAANSISVPVFVSETEFEVCLPSGIKRKFSVNGEMVSEEYLPPALSQVRRDDKLTKIQAGSLTFWIPQAWQPQQLELSGAGSPEATTLAIVQGAECQIELQRLNLYSGASVEDAAYTLQLQLKSMYTNCNLVPSFKWSRFASRLSVAGERFVFALAGSALRQYFVFATSGSLYCFMMRSDYVALEDGVELFDEILRTLT